MAGYRFSSPVPLFMSLYQRHDSKSCILPVFHRFPRRRISAATRNTITAAVIAVLLLGGSSDSALAEELMIGHFSIRDPARGLPSEWEPLVFPMVDRHTHYFLVRDQSQTVIQADSHAAASGLIRRADIDPGQYSVIQWRWKIAHVLEKGDETRKQGDDYAARIYVAFAFDEQGASWWQRLRHKSASLVAGKELPGTALNYVWASRLPPGGILNNPYADETKMIVLQSGNARSGQWVTEQRDLVEDYRQAFGRKPPRIVGIGLMSDTDDTQETTTAYYGDIILLSP
jgi:hypothetical protein